LGIYVNAQLLADQFASHGYHVLVPDILQGDPLRQNEKDEPIDLQKWIAKWTQPASVTISEEIVQRTIQYAREEMKMEKLCAVGYCYGGKVYSYWRALTDILYQESVCSNTFTYM